MSLMLMLSSSAALSYGDCDDGIPQGTGVGGENSGDCLCDTAIPTAVGTNVIWCEDWEANSLYHDVSHPDVTLGNNSYPWGPPYDEDNNDPGWIHGTGHRGANGYMYRRYTSEPNRSIYQEALPPTVKLGDPCIGSGGYCFGYRIWHYDGTTTGKWDANETYPPFADESHTSPMVIYGDGDFQDEIATLTDPVVPNLGSGVFDGHFSKGNRNEDCGLNGVECVGIGGRSAGIHGRVDFSSEYPAGGTDHVDLGITSAVAFASNVETTGIWDQAWKMLEITPGGFTAQHDAIHMFNQTGDFEPGFQDDQDNQRPFHLFLASFTGLDQDCTDAVNGATLIKGHLYCAGDDTIKFRPRVSEGYDWYEDWGPGKWGCVRTQITGGGSATTEIKKWFNEDLIIHITGLDTRDFIIGADTPGYTGISLNNYANANAWFDYQPGNEACGGQGGAGCTDETTFRYQDNVVVTDGAPVTCEAIGFQFEASPASPVLITGVKTGVDTGASAGVGPD